MMEDLADAPKSPNSTTTTCTTNPPQHNTIPSHSFGELATTGSVMLTEPDSPIESSTKLDKHMERYVHQLVLGVYLHSIHDPQ